MSRSLTTRPASRRPVVVFRTHGGHEVGFGHLRRCITLGRALRNAGATTCFVVNDDPTVVGLLTKHAVDGIGVNDADWSDLRQTVAQAVRWGADALVVDSYDAPVDRLADLGFPVVAVIDDLGEHALPVAMVINGAAHARDLAYRVRPDTTMCLGLDYVLLRDEFSIEPRRDTATRVRRALVTVGGADPFLLASSLITWIRAALDRVTIDVLVGPFWSPDARSAVERAARDAPDILLHEDPAEIRELMLSCDVAVSGGGQTVYELAATATPVIAIRLFENQTGNLRALSAKDALLWLGDAADGDLGTKVVTAVKTLDADPARRTTLGQRARSLVDGRGASRVARALLQICAARASAV